MSLSDVHDLARLIGTLRLPLHDEKAMQADLSLALAARTIVHEREVRLGPGDVVDFMVTLFNASVEIAVECKRRGAIKSAAAKQVERYAKHDRVAAVVVATGASLPLPPRIAGKPVLVVNLGRAWL